MRRRSELMQLEMGMSTIRYLPASGTAGLARSLVSGNSRVPWPPPMMTESTLLVLSVCRPVCDIKGPLSGVPKCLSVYTGARLENASTEANSASGRLQFGFGAGATPIMSDGLEQPFYRQKVHRLDHVGIGAQFIGAVD